MYCIFYNTTIYIKYNHSETYFIVGGGVVAVEYVSKLPFLPFRQNMLAQIVSCNICFAPYQRFWFIPTVQENNEKKEAKRSDYIACSHAHSLSLWLGEIHFHFHFTIKLNLIFFFSLLFCTVLFPLSSHFFLLWFFQCRSTSSFYMALSVMIRMSSVNINANMNWNYIS